MREFLYLFCNLFESCRKQKNPRWPEWKPWKPRQILLQSLKKEAVPVPQCAFTLTFNLSGQRIVDPASSDGEPIMSRTGPRTRRSWFFKQKLNYDICFSGIVFEHKFRQTENSVLFPTVIQFHASAKTDLRYMLSLAAAVMLKVDLPTSLRKIFASLPTS